MIVRFGTLDISILQPQVLRSALFNLRYISSDIMKFQMCCGVLHSFRWCLSRRLVINNLQFSCNKTCASEEKQKSGVLERCGKECHEVIPCQTNTFGSRSSARIGKIVKATLNFHYFRNHRFCPRARYWTYIGLGQLLF